MTDLRFDNDNFIFNGTCRAVTGVVAAVSSFLAERDCYICALEQFDDESTSKFFMRAVFRRQSKSPNIDAITEEFSTIAQDLAWSGNFTSPR